LADDIVWEPGFEAQFLLNNKSSNILALAAATLDAQVAWARGEKEQAIQAWRQPVKLESKIHTTSHRRGSTRCGNRWPPLSCAAGGLKAESVFRAAIRKQPRDGRLLFSLWPSLTAQKRQRSRAR